MATITLTLPVSGTVVTAGLHSTNYTIIQNAINGGLDTANWGAGKIFAPSKFMQEGATTGQILQWNGTAWVPATGSGITYGTTLPGSPADGALANLVDSLTNPSYSWFFRYNGADTAHTDKWEFMGGAPAFVEVATAEALTSATYAALATAGPSFTVPRAGIYDVAVGFRQTATSEAGQAYAAMSYDIGATGAVDGDSARAFTYTSTNPEITVVKTRRKAGLAASTALVSKYKASSAVSHTLADRYMIVTPVRVS